MLNGQACAKFQSQIVDESEVIQILKVVRWHFCQGYNVLSMSINIYFLYKSSRFYDVVCLN